MWKQSVDLWLTNEFWGRIVETNIEFCKHLPFLLFKMIENNQYNYYFIRSEPIYKAMVLLINIYKMPTEKAGISICVNAALVNGIATGTEDAFWLCRIQCASVTFIVNRNPSELNLRRNVEWMSNGRFVPGRIRNSSHMDMILIFEDDVFKLLATTLLGLREGSHSSENI